MDITKKIMNRIISLGCSYAIDVAENNVRQCEILNIEVLHNNQQSHFPGSSIELLLENVKNRTNLKRFKDYKFIMDITQVGRLSKKIPNEIVKELSEYGELFLDNYGGKDEPNGIVNLDLQIVEKLANWSENNYFDIFSTNMDIESKKEGYPKKYKEWWEKEWKLHYLKSIEDHIKDYLITIKKIQDELIGYDYKMYLMNNTFEGYFYKDNILQHKYSNHNEYTIPDLKNTIEVKDLYPKLWKDIDLSKFTFYSTNGNTYGGLDEYTIDNFSKDYLQDYGHNDLTPFGKHPNIKVQRDFLNKMILN